MRTTTKHLRLFWVPCPLFALAVQLGREIELNLSPALASPNSATILQMRQLILREEQNLV